MRSRRELRIKLEPVFQHYSKTKQIRILRVSEDERLV